VIDNSASIPPNDFGEVKEFSIGLIDNIKKGGTDLNVGLIEFSDKAIPSIWLGKNEDLKDIKRTFGAMKQPAEGYNTNTHIALFIARTQMMNLTYEEGARCTCPKVLILITDGSPSWGGYTYNEAAATREQGIHLFVVGTGPDANFPSGTMGSQTMLAMYYTGGVESMVFRVPDYSKLKNIAKSVVEGTCEGKMV
jgi:hypothetical protein